MVYNKYTVVLGVWRPWRQRTERGRSQTTEPCWRAEADHSYDSCSRSPYCVCGLMSSSKDASTTTPTHRLRSS